jgi:pimeloyl-ACP methyl ester carboxylesterase
MSGRERTVLTSHGAIAVVEHGRGDLPVLLIHGNSFSRDVFQHQLHGRLPESHRLIAFDLPGHGRSSNTPEPSRSYTRPGLADAAIELLERLEVSEAVVLGWSLGGHVGVEMMARFSGMRGLMLTGAPPVGRNAMAHGFRGSPHSGLAGKEDLSEAEIDAYVQTIFGRSPEPFLRDAVARTDGRFRKRLFEAARAGEGVDQRVIVEGSPVPLAVVNGGTDSAINLDYFETVAYANLWEGQCHRLPGLGHAPFWEAPEDFNSIFERFLGDLETGRADSAVKPH